ncbi:MAG: hypothetical protein ACPKM0_12260 [Pleomorphochaeta sp.]
MKYHSTLKSIFTISLIILILLLISIAGIFNFQAKTPVQAVNKAIFTNLEIPNGYSIEIEEINESFLLKQKIKSLKIKKENLEIVTIEDLEINQSLLNYIGYAFFDKTLNLNISAKSLNLNIVFDISDLSSALSQIKIKDNTIAIQSKLERKEEIKNNQELDYKIILDQIINQQYIDLSTILYSSLFKNDITLSIDSGSINLERNNILFNSLFSNLNFSLEKNGILNILNCDFSLLKFERENYLASANNFNVSYDKKKINLFLNSLYFNNNENNVFINSGNISYDLDTVGQIIFNLEKTEYDNDLINLEIDELKAQYKTNFEDYSITLIPKDFVLSNLNNDDIKFEEANIGLSSVNQKLSFYFNNENNMYINYQDNLYNFNDIDLSLLSSKSFFDKGSLRISDFNLINNNNNVNLNNLIIRGVSSLNDEKLYTDGVLDFSKLSNLKDSYESIILDLQSDIVLSNEIHKINTKLSSSLEITEFIKEINASVSINDLSFDDLLNDINAELFINGPLKIAEGNVQTVEAAIDYGNYLNISAYGDMEKTISNNNVNVSIIMDELPINDFSTYIYENIPVIKNYFDDDTILIGSIYYDGSLPIENEGFSGKLNSTILAKQSIFIDNRYDISFNLKSDINNSNLSFDMLSVSLFNYRLAFEGDYNLLRNNINGKVNVKDIETGDEILYVNLNESLNKNSTDFNLNINALTNFNYNGSFINVGNNIYKIESDIAFGKDIFDLQIFGDIENLKFSAYSNLGLDLELAVKEQINVDLNFNDLLIKSIDNTTFNGDVSFKYKNNNNWVFDLSQFNLVYNNIYSFNFDGNITQDSILLNDVDYHNIKYNTFYTGAIKYSGPQYLTLYHNNFNLPYELNLTYGDNTTQRIEASLFNEGEINNIFLNISNFNIARLFNNDKEILLNSKLIGETDFHKTNDLKGKIEILETGTFLKPIVNTVESAITVDETTILSTIISFVPFINLPEQRTSTIIEDTNEVEEIPLINFSSNLYIKNENYLLENLNLIINNFSINNTKINLDTKNVELSIQTKPEIISPNIVVNQTSSLDLNLLINFKSLLENAKDSFSIETLDYNTALDFYNKVRNIKDFDYRLLDNVYGDLNLTNIVALEDVAEYELLWEKNIDEDFKFQDINGSFNITDGIFDFTSSNINSKIDLNNKNGSLNIDKEFGIASDITFDYSNNDLDAYVNNIVFPVSFLARIINVKLIKFYGEDFKGSLYFTDIFKNIKYYGEVTSTNFKMKSLYTYDNEISAPNITILFNEDKLYTNNFKGKYIDLDTNDSYDFTASSTISLPNFLFDFFEIDMIMPEYIPAFLPLLGMNFTIDTKVKNYFKYATDGSTSYLSGDLMIKDSVIRSGVNLPSWIKTVQEVNGDLTVVTGENNTFYYPHLDNPILKLVMDKNQNIDIKFDSETKTYSPTGTIEILQGEIFYFQKNFFLNEGTFALNVNSVTKKLEPVISLDATLSDIDSNGDSIDIILRLNNSTLTNLNPMFTSIPNKSQQEIMEILGQSFSTSSDSDSIASIATAATSVFSSLGYIDTGSISSLNNVIASTLNLDFFSLNSSIVENIILESIIYDSSYSSYSPLARYLNNTSIYMGKYITDDSKFQILINLIASDEEDITSFLTSDLALDFEMSYEIDTKLAEFSFFTNPTQLSILKILDTIGFSVTKTIHFR